MTDNTTIAKKRRPKGTGSIQELPSGKFKLEIIIGRGADGKRIRKTFTGSTKKEVQEMLNRYQVAKQDNLLIPTSEIKFEDYINRYLNLNSQLKAGTRADYISIIKNHFLDEFGHYRVQKINTILINNFLDKKVKSHLSPSSITKIKSVLHAIFEFAKRENLIVINPVENSIRIKNAKQKRDIYIPEEHLRYIFNKAEEYHKNPSYRHGSLKILKFIINVALQTGGRIGEILALEWADVDMINNTIMFNKTVAENKGGLIVEPTPKTATSNRKIAVSKELIDSLLEIKTTCPLLFHTKNNTHFSPSNVSRSWRTLLADVDLKGKYHIHDIRHTHATLSIRDGANIIDVSRRLGHSDMRTTSNLYYATIEEQDKAIATKANSWGK